MQTQYRYNDWFLWHIKVCRVMIDNVRPPGCYRSFETEWEAEDQSKLALDIGSRMWSRLVYFY